MQSGRRFGVQLLHLRCGCTGDGDPPRLHGLRNFTHKFDVKQAIFEGSPFDLNMVGQIELPLERAERDYMVQDSRCCFSALRPSTVNTFCSAVIAISSGENPASASDIW